MFIFTFINFFNIGVCAYGYGYGWEISYPRQAWTEVRVDAWFGNLLRGPFDRPGVNLNDTIKLSDPENRR